MPRPKSFDRDEVLKQAMDIFWMHGFTDTSIQALSHATGLLPGSLYAEFHSKQQLFVDVLDYYYLTMLKRLVVRLERPGPPLHVLRMSLRHLTKAMAEREPRVGCLMTNATTEDIAKDPLVAERIGRYVAMLHAAFYALLCRAQQEGDLCEQSDPRAISSLLTTIIVGNNVVMRTSLAPALPLENIETIVTLIAR